MSAADRMVVRTRDGAYKSVPRRTGLGMISRGHAQVAPDGDAPAPTIEAPDEPHNDEYQAAAVTEPDAATPNPTGTSEQDEPALDLPAEPRGNASRQEWAEYAVSLGVEVTDGMSRNRIRDAAQDVAQTLDRLPQPALSGGRLDTPEDEPVTEESVTDDEDPGTR